MTESPRQEVKGFLPDDEGQFLHQLALHAAHRGPLLEIGSYCGRSTIWLGRAAELRNTVVFAIDHHRGSEEHQSGELFHDAELLDSDGEFDSLPAFRRNIASHELESTVIPIISGAERLAAYWQSPQLGMVFIDGGHSMAAAVADYRGWAPRVATDGLLVIHDVFSRPAEGGQAPFTVWQMALDSGLFEEHAQRGSIRALKRVA